MLYLRDYNAMSAKRFNIKASQYTDLMNLAESREKRMMAEPEKQDVTVKEMHLDFV